MVGVSIPALICGFIVGGICAIVGGYIGKMLVRGVRKIFELLFPEVVIIVVNNNAAVMQNQAQVVAQEPQYEQEVNNDPPVVEQIVIPPHSCDPPTDGYIYAECIVCNNTATVGWIHGEVMHVCLCADCAPQVRNQAICPLDRVPVDDKVEIVNDRGEVPLCPRNHCLYIGTCRICDNRGTRATFNARRQMLLWCEEHKPDDNAVRIYF